MRDFARIGLAVLGLAAAVPTTLQAEPPASATTTATTTPAAVLPHKHPVGLFGRPKLCPDCQRAQLHAQGIEIPPPPPIAVGDGAVVEAGQCTVCAGGPVTMPEAPVMAGGAMAAAPGRAVVSDAAPGRAVVGGEGPLAEPAPIGLVQARPDPRGAGRSAPSDRSIMPTRLAPDPITSSPRASRPHILAHMFAITALGREFRETQERRTREKHASIPYGAREQPLNELPASVVYKGQAR